MKNYHPVIEANILESICRVIGDTNKGFTGSELGKLIIDAKMNDNSPEMTKWKRLYNACVEFQNSQQCSNNIWTLILNAYNPAKFINQKGIFEEKRSELNKVLSFLGVILNEKGKFNKVSKSETISDAEKRATFLKTRLQDRNVHNDVLKFCDAELLQENYFHAVFEATKSVADKIRYLTGLSGDGSTLVDDVFKISNPKLRINNLLTETEQSEHKGFANLLRGFFGMFRNTTAHAPRIKWEIIEEDALDMMSMASLMHRKLDNAEII